MAPIRLLRAALVLGSALAPIGLAHAADCAGTGAQVLVAGTVAPVAPGAPRSYSIELAAGEGVIVDLANLAPPPAPSGGNHDDHGDSDEDAPPPRDLRLCDAQGKLLAPQPGEVFEKGASVTRTDDGQRLRFVAPVAGRYLISVVPADGQRELLVRRRDAGSAQAAVRPASLGSTLKGTVSSSAPLIYSFAAPAGQWVELKSTSERDTVLRLAGPNRRGEYSKIAENDDSDGANPVLRQRLANAGTYYVQVDSLAEEPGEFELSLKRIDAPRPAPPPAPLRLGATVGGKLADAEDKRFYSLAVLAGHSYRLELTAPYDGVVAIGVPNPVQPDSGDASDMGYTDVKSQDSNLSGTEKLEFGAAANGTLLVRVKSFGIGETDGGYTLTATDLGD